MHELSIATELIRCVLSVAEQHGADHVEEVVVEAGQMKAIVPEALEMAWQTVTEGTGAEGARMTLIEIPIQARCRQCGRQYQPGVSDYVCPACGEADADITAGNDLVLKSISWRAPEEVPNP